MESIDHRDLVSVVSCSVGKVYSTVGWPGVIRGQRGSPREIRSLVDCKKFSGTTENVGVIVSWAGTPLQYN